MFDKNGKLISNPVHYRDEKRAKDFITLLKIIPGYNLFKLTCSSVSPLFDLSHIFSLKLQDSPEILYGDKLLAMADIFNYFLTGKMYNEVTRLTTSILYDQRTNKMVDEIFDKLNLPKNIFPHAIKPGEEIGNISKNITTELGIKSIKVAAPATHDTASAVAGIPVVEKNFNWAFLSMGTWCCVGMETEKPLISDEIFKLGYIL